MSERRKLLAVLAAIFIYIALFGFMSSLRHYNFQTQAWDMGIFTQILWNTINGNFMLNSIEEIPNHLGVHMSPVLFLFAAGFLVFQSPYFLLILQTAALALGALPLYFFAKRVLGRGDFALILAVGYLLYPALHWVNLFDFHPIAFLAPALLAAFYFFYEARWFWFWVFVILAASTREDAALAVMFSGLFLAFVNWRKTKERKMGLWAAVTAFIYFAVSVKIIMPIFGGGLLRLDRYAHLGNSFSEIAQNLFFQPLLFFKTVFVAQKFAYLFWIFLPVAFFLFIYPLSFLLLAPGLLENLLTNFPNQFSGFYQYDSMIIAGVFVSSVYALAKILDKWPSKGRLFKIILMSAIFAGFLFRSPAGPFYFQTGIFSAKDGEILRQVVKNVPKEASVAAHTNLVPHLAKRENIYMAGHEPFAVDAVILDGADLFGFESPEDFQAYADSYALSGNYDIQIIEERYIIFTKK